MRKSFTVALAMLLTAGAVYCQSAAPPTYQPKFKGDPARSESEAAALGYLRTVVNAEREYKKKHGAYATALAALVHSGSFTRRMVRTDRGDYKASLSGTGKDFSLRMTPIEIGPDRRAFYVNEKGVIRADEQKAAGPDSPALK